MSRNQLPRLAPRPVRAIAIVAAFLAASGFAAKDTGPRDLAMVPPAAVGMDQAGLDKLAAALRDLVDRGQLAGVVTAVARHGKLVQFEAYGKQDLEAVTPMTRDTIFRIYSMTKPVTGVALMTLYEEGKFTLDDPVEKFIPQLAGLQVAAGDGPDGKPLVEPAHHKVTIRELMSHTAGFTYGFFSRSQVDTLYQQAGVLDPNSSLEAMVTKLGKIPLRQQPGSMWHYSVAVDIQGRLIEVLAGKPFDQVLQQRIFGPLGMKDTAFFVPGEKYSRFARLYVPDKDGKLQGQAQSDYTALPGLPSGGGGLVSTAMDYLRFAQMLANGGELDGVRILQPETIALMRSNQLPKTIAEIPAPYAGEKGNTFGLDFALIENPDPATTHPRARGEYWWYGVAGTWFGINPTEDLVVVGMIQNRGGSAARDARHASKRLAYEAIVDPAPATR